MATNRIQPGDRFGKLTTIRFDKSRGYNGSGGDWLCQCDCGNTTYARSGKLKAGQHKSCSCGYTSFRLKNRLPNDLGPKREKFRHYKRQAKIRNIDFKLSENQFFKLILGDCVYCGEPPSNIDVYTKRSLDRGFKTNGIDRTDNNKGYIIDNCVSCCKICNHAKATLSLVEWKTWLKKIANKWCKIS